MSVQRTKKQIKAIKKEIVESGAINIGYNPIVLKHIPSYALVQAVRVISDNKIPDDVENALVESIIITKCIEWLSYSEFKDIVKFFYISDNE